MTDRIPLCPPAEGDFDAKFQFIEQIALTGNGVGANAGERIATPRRSTSHNISFSAKLKQLYKPEFTEDGFGKAKGRS